MVGGGLGGLKDRVTDRLRRERQRRPWFDHVVRAYQRYKSANGDHLAAAITYFSFLALFPLILLGISVAGFVLANNAGLLQDLQGLIRDNVPGELGRQLSGSVESVIANRSTIGVIGLLGIALAGLGWIGNLRTALQMVWSCEQVGENFIKAKLGDLLVLIGLGLGFLASIALTAGGTAAGDQLVRAVGLGDVPGMRVLTTALGIALAVVADMLLFAWIFVRLPRRPVQYRTVLRGALLGAVGYEVLKVVGTFYLTRVTSNPTYGPFASPIGLLIWIDLVSRFLLLTAAWTATGEQPAAPTECDDTPSPTDASARPTTARGMPAPVPAGSAPAGSAPAGSAPAGSAPAGSASVPSGPVPAGSASAPSGSAPAGSAPGPVDGRRAALADRRHNGTPNPVAVAGVLVGTGAALGAGAAVAGRRLRRHH